MVFALLEGLGSVDGHVFHAIVVVRDYSGGCWDRVFFEFLLVGPFCKVLGVYVSLSALYFPGLFFKVILELQ